MGAAESLFQEIVDGGYATLKRFVEDQQEEHLHLDFKQKRDRRNGVPEEDDKRAYSEALSGFANSDGGVLVWGVRADRQDRNMPDVATELKPISYHRTFLTQLNSLAPHLVARSVDGIRNAAVDEPTTSELGFVVSLVPLSVFAPHRAEAAGVKRYYKRNAASFIQMEHFELEDLFGRRRAAVLSASCRFSTSSYRRADNQVLRLAFHLQIQNTGQFLAQNVALRINDWPAIASQDLASGWNHLPPDIFSLKGEFVLHPTLTMDAMHGQIDLTEERSLPPPIFSGQLFAATTPLTPFRLEFSWQEIEAHLGGKRLPRWLK